MRFPWKEKTLQYDIEDKVIVITGAGRGLGKALALGLAREGARVCALTLEQEESDRLRSELSAISSPERFLSLQVDVTDEAQVLKAAQAVDEAWGRVDGLVNSAAYMPDMMPVTELEVDRIRHVFDVNIVGYFITTKHFAPIMVRGGGGRIIYMSSIIGVQANPGQSVYGATKAGINILNNVVHREMADKGIRTVALAPGLTDTPGMRAIVSAEYVDHVAAAYPGGRIGEAEDIVPFVAFLCSDAAAHLSGTFLPIRPVAG
jgi:NAD(P)-dependent dehydrogenase (short-subunit alcohol dehydrogenase family)